MRARGITAWALFASLATPAAAQTPPGKFDRAPQLVAQNVRSEDMARCALGHDRRRAVTIAMTSADAATMLSNPAASPEEAAAFRRMMPSLQACAPAEGEVRINPARVRPATAIALYRLVATK